MHRHNFRGQISFPPAWIAPRRVAWAHSTSECYFYLRPRGTSLDGSVQMPMELVANAIDAGFDRATVEDLESHRDAIVSLVSSAFTLSESGAALGLQFGDVRVVDTGAGRFCAVRYRAPEGTSPRTVTLSIDGLLEVDHHVAAVAVVSTNEGWGKFGRRIRDQHRLDHHHPSRDIDLAEPSFVDHVTTTAQGIFRRSKSRVSANQP